MTEITDNEPSSSNNKVVGIVDDVEITNTTLYHHLLIILNNSHGNKSVNGENNYNCDIFIQLCDKLGAKHHYLENKSFVGDFDELMELMNSYNDRAFTSRWLVFIGSAIEYGPVGEGNRIFKVNQMLNAWNGVTEPKVLLVFGSPNVNRANVDITNDNKDTEGIHTFHQLLSGDYEEEVEAMTYLNGNIKIQLLSSLDKNVNYFFSPVPISLINDNKDSILNTFVHHMQSAAVKHESLSSTFQSICCDFKQKLFLPDTLLPLCQVTNDFNI